MHAFTIAAALVSIVSLSAAAPTIEKRQDAVEAGEVTICTGANKSGYCYTKTYNSNECNILPPLYYKNVLTFAPGHQILCRVTTSQNSCTPHGDLFIEYPGSTQFNDYNDADYSGMTSFLCQKCTYCH